MEDLVGYLTSLTVLDTLSAIAAILAIGGALIAFVRFVVSRRRAASILEQIRRGSTEPPILGKFAREFEATNRIKKFTRPLQSAFRDNRLSLIREQESACTSSNWKLDRIAVYLFQEASRPNNPEERLGYVQQEYDETSNEEFKLGLVPLHYALRSLKELLIKEPTVASVLKERIPDLETMLKRIESRSDIDETNHVKDNLKFIIKKLSGTSDSKKIEPDYALDIKTYKPHITFSKFGTERVTVQFPCTFENCGRKPIALVASQLTVETPHPLKVTNDQSVKFDLYSYRDRKQESDDIAIRQRHLIVPKSQIETVELKYRLMLELKEHEKLQLRDELNNSKELSLRIQATDIEGNEFYSQSLSITRSHL